MLFMPSLISTGEPSLLPGSCVSPQELLQDVLALEPLHTPPHEKLFPSSLLFPVSGKLFPWREDTEVDVSPYFFSSPPCPCLPHQTPPSRSCPSVPTPYSDPGKCSLLPTTVRLPRSRRQGVRKPHIPKEKAERPGSILGEKGGIGGDAVTLWPMTAAPEGHRDMEVRRDETDELWAPRPQVRTHLRAVLTESRGKSVLLMAVQPLSLPQPVRGEQIHIQLHHKWPFQWRRYH